MNEPITGPDLGQAFLEAIAERPQDPANYLIYADWLAEQGQETEKRVYRLAGFVLESGWARGLERLFGWPQSTISGVVGLPAFVCDSRDSHEQMARRLLAWATEHQARLEQAAQTLVREMAWLARAAQGDVAALLAHRGSRIALRALAAGEKPPRFGKRATDYCTSKKAIAAAKARMAARRQRVAARQAGENARAAQPARIHALWIEKLHQRAVAEGERYHRHVRSLYQSKRAEVVYGRGGQETEDRDAYAKSYRAYNPHTGNSFRPAARWRNAGARLDSESRPSCIILENFRGTEVARRPLKEGT